MGRQCALPFFVCWGRRAVLPIGRLINGRHKKNAAVGRVLFVQNFRQSSGKLRPVSAGRGDALTLRGTGQRMSEYLCQTKVPSNLRQTRSLGQCPAQLNTFAAIAEPGPTGNLSGRLPYFLSSQIAVSQLQQYHSCGKLRGTVACSFVKGSAIKRNLSSRRPSIISCSCILA